MTQQIPAQQRLKNRSVGPFVVERITSSALKSNASRKRIHRNLLLSSLSSNLTQAMT